MSAKDLILERFPTLSPRLQAAARFVVDHPNEVVTSSMRTLAERAGAQPAALVRLAQQLGYAGWPELKAAFVDDLGLHSDRYGSRAKKLTARGRDAAMAHELFSTYKQNLVITQRQCEDRLREAIQLIKRAKNIHVAGFRASHPVAFTFFYGCRLFRNNAHLIHGHSAGLEADIRPIERSDVVLVVGFAPYSRESIIVMEHAKAVGAHVLALTDSQASPLALGADLSLLFAIDSPSFFPSVAAAVALAEALLEQLVADGGDDVVTQIEHVERQLHESGAYVQTPTRRTLI